MTETSQEKTKRKTVEILSSDQWSYQLSIFYRCFSNRLLALEHKEKVTRVLKRLNPEQTMLYRLCLYNAPHEHLDDINDNDLLTERMPYHAIFSPFPFDQDESEIAKALSKATGVTISVLKRSFKGGLKRRYLSAIKAGELHELKEYFTTNRVRSYYLINRKGSN